MSYDRVLLDLGGIEKKCKLEEFSEDGKEGRLISASVVHEKKVINDSLEQQ